MKYIKVFAVALMLVFFSGCSCNIHFDGSNESSPVLKPELSEVRSICSLSTLECYYHNVAISDKPAGDRLKNLLEVDRTFMIEYSGIVRIGVDLSKLNMTADGKTITVTLPSAEILGIKVDETSIDENSILVSKDRCVNKNPIEAEDQTAAIRAAQENMLTSAQEDDALLLSAQSRARELIEIYINQLSELSGIPYEIVWVYDA